LGLTEGALKFVYHGDHNGARIGIALPVLDLHGRPLVNPEIVPADSEKAAFHVVAGRPFVVDHKNFERGLDTVCQWMCTHNQFTVLDREVRPKKASS
jgi:hypothetical protein